MSSDRVSAVFQGDEGLHIRRLSATVLDSFSLRLRCSCHMYMARNEKKTMGQTLCTHVVCTELVTKRCSSASWSLIHNKPQLIPPIVRQPSPLQQQPKEINLHVLLP